MNRLNLPRGIEEDSILAERLVAFVSCFEINDDKLHSLQVQQKSTCMTGCLTRHG